jgi:hypothetical protein
MRALRTYVELETHVNAAAKLGISTQTLKNHLGSAYRKIGKRKAHSALYKMCLDQGFDPLTEWDPVDHVGNQTSPLTDSWTVEQNDTDEAAS